MSYHFAFKVASETDKSHNTLPIGPRTKNALLAGFWLLASIAFIVLPLVSINFVFDHFVTTTTTKTETIHTPFTTELEQDPLVAPAESYTSDGTVGVTEVTYQIKTRDGKQVAKTETNSQVITQAEPQIYHQGTLSPITPQLVVGTVRTGARCNDGSYSGATGRGACSWHGGVAEWLY